MAYTPPVGTADLALTGSYTPPVGTADLIFGGDPSANRTAALAGVTLAPTGSLAALKGPVVVLAGSTAAPTGRLIAGRIPIAVLAGVTLAPTGSIQAKKAVLFAVAGTTLAPTGNLNSAWDPNLLSAVHAVMDSAWQEGQNASQGLREVIGDAPDLRPGAHNPWQDAALLNESPRPAWREAQALQGIGAETWQEAGLQARAFAGPWNQAPRLDSVGGDRWQNAADLTPLPLVGRFHVRTPLFTPAALPVWQEGTSLTRPLRDGMQDGLRLLAVEVEIWQRAGYPGNAPNPGPAIPVPVPWPWGTTLNLRCPLPGTTLRIGRSPCILIAERDIPVRRTYMSTNNATLVRWPDLTPLPVIAMSVETDFDSWCWALSATLAGPDAWPLVQPNPLACEVQATINGQVWRFLLDVPSTNRSFNSDRVTLKGRSRSAWLHDPYTLSSNRSETDAREMVQLAEAALENTGWTLDWQLENWVVPAYRYVSWNTPIGALIRLVNTTDDGLYTDPYEQVLTARKRWPVASWLVDGETADLALPEAAVISLTQSPVYSQPLNGVYVSGTSHGALALVKIAGTDGALQPTEPIVNELLCDEAGVAARARGLNLLSDSGAGWELDAEVLFTPEVGLVRPGLIVSIAGVKGISRSCRIQCNWSGGGLAVRQSVGLERREVEA